MPTPNHPDILLPNRLGFIVIARFWLACVALGWWLV